jgi:Ran GTPase-activating protein (RanGAP) involved in mRNA processing and transport
MDSNDRKLLGNKKLLFNVIKKTEKDGLKSQKVSKKNKEEVSNFIHQQVQNFSKTETNISSENFDKSESIIIKSGKIQWKEKVSLTFQSLVSKYLQEKRENNTELYSDDTYDFEFRLFFHNNTNVFIYSFREVKDSTLAYLEKKHKGKLSEVYMDMSQRKGRVTNFKEREGLFDSYKQYIRYLVDPKNVKFEIINKNLSFTAFKNNYPDQWDWFETYVIEKLSEEKNLFNDLNSYINLYLYDNLRKLKEPKVLESLKSKLRDFKKEELDLLKSEMNLFYIHRQQFMRSDPGQVDKWSPEKSLIEVLISAFIHSKLKKTTEIDLTQHFIQSDNVLTFLSALKAECDLEKLSLNCNKIGEEGLWQIGRICYYSNRISELDISMNSLSDDAIKALWNGLGNMNVSHSLMEFNNLSFPFTKLNLSNNSGLTCQCGESLSRIIRASPHLKSLNVSRNNLEDSAMIPIIEALKFNKSVETLIIYSTKISGNTILALKEYLARHDCSLVSLILSDNKIDSFSGRQLFISLQNNKCLKELSLMNCDISNELAEDIQNMIRKNTALKILHLYNNKIDKEEAFLKILSACKLLSETCELYNNFDFASNQGNSLEDWELFLTQRNELTPVDKEKLYELDDEEADTQIKKNSNLKCLDLSKNRCKISITDKFLNLIENLFLESLDISQNSDFTADSNSDKFKSSIVKIQHKTKIIY